MENNNNVNYGWKKLRNAAIIEATCIAAIIALSIFIIIA